MEVDIVNVSAVVDVEYNVFAKGMGDNDRLPLLVVIKCWEVDCNVVCILVDVDAALGVDVINVEAVVDVDVDVNVNAGELCVDVADTAELVGFVDNGEVDGVLVVVEVLQSSLQKSLVQHL